MDLKDGYENKEEISNFKSTKSQIINNSSNPIGNVYLGFFWENVSGYIQTFQKFNLSKLFGYDLMVSKNTKS